MQNLLNFWSFIFWLSIILFLTNTSHLIKLILYSELIWIVFYCYLNVISTINDDLNLISTNFFILGFAGLEYSIGILLVLLFKNINNNLNIIKNDIFLNKFNYNKELNIVNIK